MDQCKPIKNTYKFLARYGVTTIERTVKAETYNAALNLMYFPCDETQADQCSLIAMKTGSIWLYGPALSNPSHWDFPKGS